MSGPASRVLRRADPDTGGIPCRSRSLRPLKAEHDELHAELAHATKAGGRTGEAAQAVARALHAHFRKEEEYALPPLGLLVDLAEGRIDRALPEALRMTDRLAAEMPSMLAEHKEIVAALKRLIDAAKAESKPQHVHFAEKLLAHVQTEEEIAYPAALLIGRYLKTVLPAMKHKAA